MTEDAHASRLSATGRRLVLFTRLPEPGRTKTRLIGALGAVGAAELQRRMARYAANTARGFASSNWVTVQVLVTGGDPRLLEPWLGGGLHFGQQGTGDLGERMDSAFRCAFRDGEERVVIMGTDCPDITPAVLQRAFDALHTADVVLGPASDGGYYLVGLCRSAPSLFRGLSWGSDSVLSETLRLACQEGLSVKLLDELTDVDRPEDLNVWRAYREMVAPPDPRQLAVIIPVLNEEAGVGAAVRSALPGADRVVVVDGGSGDDTVAAAVAAGAIVMSGRGGRACQQNLGAVASDGGTLVFLHGDSQLPDGYADRVHAALDERGVVAGAFELAIDAEGRCMRFAEAMINRRSRARQMPYGDQALFMRRTTFLDLGGFPDMPLMEDYELVRRLRRSGRIATLPVPVTTSGRRWRRHGLVRTTLTNQLIVLAYNLGVSPSVLARWYRGGRPG